MDYEKLVDYIQFLPIDMQKQVADFVLEKVHEFDPDYTRLTPKEAAELEEIIKENDFTPASEIDWHALEKEQ